MRDPALPNATLQQAPVRGDVAPVFADELPCAATPVVHVRRALRDELAGTCEHNEGSVRPAEAAARSEDAIVGVSLATVQHDGATSRQDGVPVRLDGASFRQPRGQYVLTELLPVGRRRRCVLTGLLSVWMTRRYMLTGNGPFG